MLLAVIISENEFVLLVYPIEGQRDTQGRRLLSESVVREVNKDSTM